MARPYDIRNDPNIQDGRVVHRFKPGEDIRSADPSEMERVRDEVRAIVDRMSSRLLYGPVMHRRALETARKEVARLEAEIDGHTGLHYVTHADLAEQLATWRAHLAVLQSQDRARIPEAFGVARVIVGPDWKPDESDQTYHDSLLTQTVLRRSDLSRAARKAHVERPGTFALLCSAYEYNADLFARNIQFLRDVQAGRLRGKNKWTEGFKRIVSNHDALIDAMQREGVARQNTGPRQNTIPDTSLLNLQ